MENPSEMAALAEERLRIFERVRCRLTEKDGPRAFETVDTYCRRWSQLLAEAQRRLSEDSE
jgi:hypothetical protein